MKQRIKETINNMITVVLIKIALDIWINLIIKYLVTEPTLETIIRM